MLFAIEPVNPKDAKEAAKRLVESGVCCYVHAFIFVCNEPILFPVIAGHSLKDLDTLIECNITNT